MLQLDHLTLATDGFRLTANLTVPTGARTAIIGPSGAGKSTIANEVEKRLNLMNRHTFLLDGDNVRHGLNKDLGFTEADRIENIRRVGEVAKLMADAGLIVLTAFINLFIGSASAKWALLAPIFVPMLMLVGYSPEVIQAAYRIGDSVTNIITPMMRRESTTAMSASSPVTLATARRTRSGT